MTDLTAEEKEFILDVLSAYMLELSQHPVNDKKERELAASIKNKLDPL